MARLVVTGDVMLGRNVAQAIEEYPPEHVWGDALQHLVSADGLLVNLECVVAASGRPAPGRTFHFRAPPGAIDALHAAGVDVASIANNHVLDFGDEALVEMLDRLDRAGLERVGAGRTTEDAWQPARIRRAGLEIGVLAFTDNTPAWDVERRQPGVAYAAVDPDGAGLQRLEQDVRGLSREVDVTVVSAHWGPNMRRVPPEDFQAVARGLVDAGADVFWGHSAHLFQAVERHGDAVILYDTGDLVDDYRIDPDEHNEIGFLFALELVQGRVGDVELTPVRIDPKAGQVNTADGSAAAFARERMRDLCGRFETRLEWTDEGGLRIPFERTETDA